MRLSSATIAAMIRSDFRFPWQPGLYATESFLGFSPRARKARHAGGVSAGASAPLYHHRVLCLAFGVTVAHSLRASDKEPRALSVRPRL
jgi:hypothetical protein